MARLTITLSDDRHRALKEAAARRGCTIGQLIDESLEYAGVKTRDDARALVARVRECSKLSSDEAQRLAVEETRRERGR
jgi:predicted DNA-binding ribbon-helix-helix protein